MFRSATVCPAPVEARSKVSRHFGFLTKPYSMRGVLRLVLWTQPRFFGSVCATLRKCKAWFSSVLVVSFCSLLVCPSAEGGPSSEERFCRLLRIGAVKHRVRGGRQRVKNGADGLDTGDVSQVTPG